MIFKYMQKLEIVCINDDNHKLKCDSQSNRYLVLLHPCRDCYTKEIDDCYEMFIDPEYFSQDELPTEKETIMLRRFCELLKSYGGHYR